MPQLNKEGKRVFGWCVVGEDGEIRIPPAACREYGFQDGETVLYLHASPRSVNFRVGRLEKLEGAADLLSRSMGEGIVRNGGRIAVPAGIDIQPGQRLLAVGGSRHALQLLTRGSTYEQALKNPAIAIFEPNVHCDSV